MRYFLYCINENLFVNNLQEEISNELRPLIAFIDGRNRVKFTNNKNDIKLFDSEELIIDFLNEGVFINSLKFSKEHIMDNKSFIIYYKSTHSLTNRVEEYKICEESELDYYNDLMLMEKIIK